MNKLYKKSEIWFAISWIIVYVVGTSIADELSRLVGIEKVFSVPYLLAMSIVVIVWMRKNGLFERFGLCKTDIGAKKFLYYITTFIFLFFIIQVIYRRAHGRYIRV